jgi:hypothetical protein
MKRPEVKLLSQRHPRRRVRNILKNDGAGRVIAVDYEGLVASKTAGEGRRVASLESMADTRGLSMIPIVGAG